MFDLFSYVLGMISNLQILTRIFPDVPNIPFWFVFCIFDLSQDASGPRFSVPGCMIFGDMLSACLIYLHTYGFGVTSDLQIPARIFPDAPNIQFRWTFCLFTWG